MDRLKRYIELLGYDEDWAIEAIRRYVDIEAKKKERSQRYYAKNKERLKEYHKNYRTQNPEYRKRNAERGKSR